MTDNCGNCKHWGGDRDDNDTFKGCQRIKHDYNYDVTDRWNEDKESVLDEPAVVQDGSGYYARVFTKANFYCSMHERKVYEPT